MVRKIFTLLRATCPLDKNQPKYYFLKFSSHFSLPHNSPHQTLLSPDSNEANEHSVTAMIKHPLQNNWTLWYFEPDRSKKWEENLNEVSTFNTVEDF